WSDALLEEVQRLLVEAGNPSPISLAAELLALGALLRGAVSTRSSEVEILREALLEWPAETPSGRSDPWAALWNAYRKSSAEVRDHLVAILACSKGGQVGSMIDPTPVMSALAYAVSNGRPHPRPLDAERWT